MIFAPVNLIGDWKVHDFPVVFGREKFYIYGWTGVRRGLE
ncbi:hypothetical protein B4098_0894 [Heyndrickxia coagulans]|uniref:Uncharacterized protein n=1 Tax=Heyndrickxia coagulans TaxID=1398 RepID=A0A150K1C6_HEYCO|nr:hypothetical protein B4098_0894 [Heyndrickxia coagulans]